MAGEYLLDTNILIAFLKEEREVEERFAAASSMSVPFAALAELFYGAQISLHAAENLRRVEQIADRFDVLFPDGTTVREYGRVRARLKAAGRPIPESDLWIAALAIQHDLVLATRDDHFQDVDRLRLERW